MSVTLREPPSDEERLARVALSCIAEPGDRRLAKLVSELGPERLRQALLAERDLDGLQSDVAARLSEVNAEQVLASAAADGIRFLIPGDPEWPTGFADLEDAGELYERGGAPVGLWIRGSLHQVDLSASVAIVGSRSSTSYGNEVAGSLAGALTTAGVSVISGGAFGIDYAAHCAAVAVEGTTVAVLAGGVDKPYPSAHRPLLEHLATHGAVVSEAPPGSAPFRVRFLARNRLIASLACGTVVVEAAVRSGALNTANWANRLNRVVMGIPGPVTSAASVGVHELIRGGGAMLVSDAHQVLELVGKPGDHLLTPIRSPRRARDQLTVRQLQVLDAVPVATAVGTESIARVAGIAPTEVAAVLDRLRQLGFVSVRESGWQLGELVRH